jgi:uncharacterized LabA/DUF88 family protein
MKNLTFIDGQNLHLGTTLSDNSWKISLVRFKIYLQQKYNVGDAYYFLGYTSDKEKDLYSNIQKAGFILVFKKHSEELAAKKKGNVDTEIVFQIMKKLYKKELFDKIVLVSGDGDFKMMVDFLIEENRFEKVLFPNRKNRSSLYKSFSNKFFAYLDDKDIKNKINYTKEKGALGN